MDENGSQKKVTTVLKGTVADLLDECTHIMGTSEAVSDPAVLQHRASVFHTLGQVLHRNRDEIAVYLKARHGISLQFMQTEIQKDPPQKEG